MEAITVAGLAALAFGGFYSFIDCMNDLGFRKRRAHAADKKLDVSRRCILTPQAGIEKMAGMNI
jgi:hypothetical protein